ncbi:MAG: single-stranded DNA-binding protein [Bacillota bacterium]|nr:single-stranded DNA-binding protein [Bacillota bacterium]
MLNNVTLMGRLTADPELRHTESGISVTSFTLAVNRSYVKQGAELQTDFIDIVAWRSTAEFITKYFTKGRPMIVQGSIQTHTYQDKEGNNRKAFEIVAEKVFFADSKNGNGGDNNYPQRSKEASAPAYSSGSTGDFQEMPMDDDLPF